MKLYAKELSQKITYNADCNYVKILPLGYVSSEKGDFLVDKESFQMMNKYMQHRGIDIVIDYEHQTLQNAQAPASGWIKELILKNDGIYAKVEWTNRAKSYLNNKEYKYLSPVVMIRVSDHKVSRIHSVALTNTPAINSMVPIVNSTKTDLQADFKLNETQKEMCRLINISEADFITYGILGGDAGGSL